MSTGKLADRGFVEKSVRKSVGKLANDNILTIDTGAQTTEHYVPSLKYLDRGRKRAGAGLWIWG